eukprot:m.52429 g.52429  ORF g.52429 m.52429 type:complete len:132 (+) comp13073_c0_seq1:312-707(+)
MVHQLQCFPNSTTCTPQTRLKMAQFLSCFEGQKIEEKECNAPIQPCITKAGLQDEWPLIEKCFNTTSIMSEASAAMNATCNAENPKWWPYVIVDGSLLCGDDSCMMPLLPPLCKAYKGFPKPKSCQKLGIH